MNSSYDVIVVGFGTAGSMAAIAAASNHASVLVLERNSYPGGTSTGGGVPGFYGQQPSGLAASIEAKAHKYAKWHSCSFIEAKKAILESEALAAGCDIVYEAVPYAVIKDGSRVKGIRWSDADGLHSACSNVLIDATADGRACQLAGCQFTIGRDSDHRCNSFTNTMLYRLDEIWLDNSDAGRIDQYDAVSFSRSIQKSLQLHILENYSIDHSQRHQLAPADICGIREGRHIVTEEFLTLEKFFDGEYDTRDDVVCFAKSNLDMHTYDIALESTVFQDWLIAASMWGTPLWFPVTRGTLVPKGTRGMIVAGRHIGVSHDYGQAVRMNAHVSRIGEAAGILATLAEDGDIMAIPQERVDSHLEAPPSPIHENAVFTSLDDDAIHDGLASDSPGFAIWSARCRKLSAPLRRWMREAPAKSNLRCHAAFALALLDDSSAIPELLRMARERDDFAPTTSRKYNHRRGYVSVYLLGRLKATEAIPVLLDILDDASLKDSFEYQSFAVAALVRLSRNGAERSLHDKLLSIAGDSDWTLMARLKGTQKYYRIDGIFREFIYSNLTGEQK